MNNGKVVNTYNKRKTCLSTLGWEFKILNKILTRDSLIKK